MAIDQPRRRFLAGSGIVAGLGLAGCTDLLAGNDNDNGLTTLTLDADGTEAYIVTAVEGRRSASDVVEDGLDANNPELSLIEEDRYRIESAGTTLESHPIRLNDESGEPLLTQGDGGTFADDDDVDWVDDGDAVEFTLTESLKEEVTTYQCDIHGGMQGPIGEGTAEEDNGGGGVGGY